MNNVLIEKIYNKKAEICVIGLGYIGLPLSLSFAKCGFKVLGIDIDEQKIRSLNNQISYISDISDEVLKNAISNQKIDFTSDYQKIISCDAIIICVPTPLNKTKDPDISYIVAVAEEIAKYDISNKLISLESTVYPGATEEIILPDPTEILSDTLVVQNQSDNSSVGSQQKISDLSNETQELLGEYRLVLQQIDRLIAYNDYVERLIEDQDSQIVDINNQLDEFALIERGIVPLMLDSIETLDKFIDLDVPFLIDERKGRVTRLRTIMDQADITVSEKYRQIMDAYQIETSYSSDIESYTGFLEIDGETRQVDFLRIGRTSLTYQTPDQDETGFWNKQTGAWESLPRKYTDYVKEGLRIAKKQITPDLIQLPIEAPKESD